MGGANVRFFSYDKVGNVLSRTDQNGNQTFYTYDDLHRLVGRPYVVSGSSNTWPLQQGPDSFGYDRAGRLLTADRPYAGPTADATLAFAYDTVGRPVTLTQGDGNPGNDLTIGYDYVMGPSERHRELTYAAGRVVRETFDLRGRVSAVTDIVGGNPATIFAQNDYSPANRLTHRAFGNGLHADWTYDSAGRVASVMHRTNGGTPTILAGVQYGRNNVGTPTWREDVVTPTHSEFYTHDAANRLIEVKRGALNAEKTGIATLTPDANLIQQRIWTLDGLGNSDAVATTLADTTTTQTRTNNKANEYLQIDPDGPAGQGGPQSPLNIEHDANGNITDDGALSLPGIAPGGLEYDYDIENRLTRVRRKSDGATIAEYYYNALGRRVRKVVTNTGTETDGEYVWLYDADWKLLEIRKVESGSPVLQQELIHAGQSSYIDDHVAMIDHTGPSPATFYYHTDAQHCTLALSDATANIVENYVTNPYGHTVVYDQNWQNATLTSRQGNPFTHQGLPYDPEKASFQNRHREYSPSLMRFMQRDPLGYVDGPSLYQYVKSEPTTHDDPQGLGSFDCGACTTQTCCTLWQPYWRMMNFPSRQACFLPTATTIGPGLAGAGLVTIAVGTLTITASPAVGAVALAGGAIVAITPFYLSAVLCDRLYCVGTMPAVTITVPWYQCWGGFACTCPFGDGDDDFEGIGDTYDP